MAKAYFTRIEPEFPDITLELTGEEARFIQALVGNVAGGGKGWQITDKIYHELRKITKSFSRDMGIMFNDVTKFEGTYK